MGGYDETPDITGKHVSEFARDGLVNIVGKSDRVFVSG